MTATVRYDQIGVGYGLMRRPDDRLRRTLHAALGDACSVLNIGAGTGNYEPIDRRVVGAEPSRVMIRQRHPLAAPAVQAGAEQLPFGDRTFDAATALSTIHHWGDLAGGLGEMCRVAGRRLIYLSERALPGRHWLADDYFPEILDLPTNRSTPMADDVANLLDGKVTITVFEIPADFAEGSAWTFWAHPERYCNPDVQAALSTFALLDPDVVQRGTARLRHDLATGRWDDRHGALRTLPSLDVGYRIVVSEA